MVASRPEWALGFEDETWWSRYKRPKVHAWAQPGRFLRMVEQSVPKDETEPKALACYGLLVRWTPTDGQVNEEAWLRFVDDRPVSEMTTSFLDWSCNKLEAMGKKALVLVWDNAPWHISKMVRNWIGEHNRKVKHDTKGVRVLVCPLPIKSPWLNPIEAKWAHGKRRIAQADGLLTAQELTQRVYDAFGCHRQEPLTFNDNAA
tara:strand:- start:71 stop:679 length:609 start_codon:yes stop_codon:yes gene_type:complete